MNDTSDPLEKRIEQYYQQQELPLDNLVDLKQMINTSAPELPVNSYPRPWWHEWIPQWLTAPPIQPSTRPAMGIAVVFAALLFCIGATIFILNMQSSQQQLETVAAEIALNHAKQFEAEFTTESIASLASTMPLLDFAPVHPRKMQFSHYDIIGARYCTIDSSIAVQVHMEDEAQQAYTLYEFRAPDSLPIAEQKEMVINVDVIQVTLWREGDVTMGLAQRLPDED